MPCILHKGQNIWLQHRIKDPSSAGLFLCRAAVGLGEGVAPSASTDMLARLVDTSQRSRATSYMFGGLHVGSLLGLLVAPPLIEAFGWQTVSPRLHPHHFWQSRAQYHGHVRCCSFACRMTFPAASTVYIGMLNTPCDYLQEHHCRGHCGPYRAMLMHTGVLRLWRCGPALEHMVGLSGQRYGGGRS